MAFGWGEAALLGGSYGLSQAAARKANRAKDAERSRLQGLSEALGDNPFPNFYSGVQGQGDQVSLDPRFQVKKYGTEVTGRSFDDLLGGIGDYTPKTGILDSALEDYNTASNLRQKGTQGAIAATGRGLLASDIAGLNQQQAQQDVTNRQQLRSQFGALDAANQVRDAEGDIGLLSRLPRLGQEVNLVDQINANRLLSELGALSNYNNENYKAKLAEAQGADFARAAS